MVNASTLNPQTEHLLKHLFNTADSHYLVTAKI